jgi:oligopeptide transport system ATP-binding protein
VPAEQVGAGAPLLRVEGMVKHFSIHRGLLRRSHETIRAVDGVSFELRRGETLGIVGESGCGKSTLARLLMLLEQPTAGAAWYRDRNMLTLDARERFRLRRQIQIVFQDPYDSLHPRMTAEQIISEPWSIHDDLVPRGERKARVRELMERVGLNPAQARNYPHQFSGGQRQRIGIARALALGPELIICDEPVSALDVSIRAQVLNLFRSIQDDLGLTYIFIAHDLSIVRHVSDRVAVMYLGRIVELGDQAAVYGTAAHPYTQALLSAVPNPDPAMRGKRRRILLAGDPPSPANPPSGCRFRTRCWKAQEVCAELDPSLEERGQGHPVACHFADVRVDLPPGDLRGAGASQQERAA